jgi:tetratricopeptide (TPR) repeat protein
MRRWNDALQQYEQGAQASPKERTLYLKRIANVWLAQGRGERAEEAIGEIRRQAPSDQEAQAVQASLLLDSGKPEKIREAASLFRTLVNEEPNNVVWRFNFGRTLAAQGDTAAAKREFLAAAEMKPDYVPPRLALARQSQAEGDYRSALKYANDMLAVEPGLPAARLLRVVSLINTGNYAPARSELVNLEKILPQEAQLQSAVLDLKEKKFQKAEDGFRKLLQKNPGNSQAIFGMVQSEAAQNQLEKARQELRQELNRSPGSETVRLLVGDVEVALGNFDSGIEQYRHLLTTKPQSAQFHLSLGRAYQLKGDVSHAITEFAEAGRLAPKDPLPPALLAYTMIAAGQMREAINNFRHALQLGPENPAVKNDLAYLLAETGGNLDEALVLAQEAVRSAPGEPDLADTLAWVYFKKNMNSSALPVFRDLAEKYPDRANFRYQFGMALRRAGNEAAAKREFRAGLAMDPPADLRRQIDRALGGS